jgi:hypothetical protein
MEQKDTPDKPLLHPLHTMFFAWVILAFKVNERFARLDDKLAAAERIERQICQAEEEEEKYEEAAV